MTIAEYSAKVNELKRKGTLESVHISPDFQCDQTNGFPTSLCVNWDEKKAWLELNEFLIKDGDDVTEFLQGCADFGIRACNDEDAFNSLLKRLGEEAYENAMLCDESMSEQTM